MSTVTLRVSIFMWFSYKIICLLVGSGNLKDYYYQLFIQQLNLASSKAGADTVRLQCCIHYHFNSDFLSH